MANKKIYKNRLSLPIFDNKGMGNGNGIAYVPNIIRGGSAIPIGNNMFFMKGKSHNQGGIDIGKDLEVERNEVVQNGKFGTRVFSSVPFLRGVSPAQRVLQGENPDAVFAAQENWKRINKINDDGSRKAKKGGFINELRKNLYASITPANYFDYTNRIKNAILNPKVHGERQYSSPNREALWAKYLNVDDDFKYRRYNKLSNPYNYPNNLENTNEYIKPSKYKPSIRKNNSSKYYSLVYPQIEDEQIQELLNSDKTKKSFYNGDAFGNYTLSKGKDKRGDYISYYDKWDMNPAKNFLKYDQSFGIGKPIELYDRIYLDDYYGIKQSPKDYKNKGDFYGGYLPPINVIGNKKFGGCKAALGLSLFRPNSFKVQELPIDNFLANSINREIETPEVPTYVLKDDEKPVGKKVNPNIIGGGRLYNGYAVDNHEKENVNGIGGGRVYTARPIDEFATDSVSFGDVKSPRGFKEQDADYIYDYLSKHSDLTDTAKAAILATAAFESGMNPRAKNKYSTAKGLFQWLDDRYIPTPGLSDEQEKIVQLNKIIDDMTPVKGKAKGWTQTKTRNIFDLANEFRTTDDIDRAVEIITRHHIRPSLGEEPRKNKQGVEVDKGYKWEIAERRKVAKQFYNRMFNRKNKKQFGGMKLNIFKLGGLSRSKDYGSKDKPYPSVDKNDFAGGGRSYPIPTRADAVDALRLAGLHHRSDVRAKVYAKYPDLRKKAAMGTIDDEDLQDLIYQQRMNSKQTNTTPEPVRTNYVERNNSSNNLGETVGQGVVGSLIGGSTIFGLNKLAKNYTPSLSKNNRFVSPNYDVVENPTNLERKYNYPKRVANRIKNSGVEELWDKRRLEDATKRINSVLDRYGDKIKIVNEPVAKEISSTQVYDVTKPKKYTPNLSEFSPKVKAGVQQINKQNLNLARRLGTNIRNIGGILGKTLPAVALVDFVRNLFPSKQQEQEADKAWRRYKSPTGRIPEDYQMKFGGKTKAPYGTYITIGGRRVPLVFDTNNKLSDQVLSLMYPTIAAGTQNLPKDFNRLSLLNTNNIGTGGSLVHAVPNRQNSNGSYFPINFDRLSKADVQNLGLTPNFPSMGFDLRGMNDFTLNALFGNLKPKDIRNAQTLSDVARAQEASLNVPSRTLVYDVPDYTGNINGQEVVINPAYMRQVPKSVRQAILNNTPEIVRGSNNTRRSVDVDNVLADSRPQFYAEENRNMYPETSRNYGFRYGWSHGATPNYGADIPASTAREANMIANIDLSKYFNSNGTPKPNPTRRTQPVSVRTERVGNIPGVYTENMKRPNLTQLGTQGIGLNMPAYENPFATRTSNYNIGLPMTLDTSRLDSTLSKYGVTPISSSTGNGINPADVEAVRSGNFKAIDNDRYVPIHTTTEDWVGLGANLLGSIGSYLGTRAMLNRYPMPSKPVPAIAQKLKTRININPQLDAIREQAGSLNRAIDNNTANSRTALSLKQRVSNNAVASKNQLYGQKENAEIPLINQDRMNHQQVGLYNNRQYNDWIYRINSLKQYLADNKIGNFNNVLSGANQSIQDLLGRVESRDALGRNLIFMQAAYPNVNWRNIFQNNRELARSFGFRFLNN